MPDLRTTAGIITVIIALGLIWWLVYDWLSTAFFLSLGFAGVYVGFRLIFRTVNDSNRAGKSDDESESDKP